MAKTSEPAGGCLVDEARFSLLATAAAGREVSVLADEPPRGRSWTDGTQVHLRTASADEQRREVLLQAALLRAGSLDREIAASLRGRPALTRRYLSVEGPRALHELQRALPGLSPTPEVPEEGPWSGGPHASLALARSRAPIPAPPRWLGVVRPARLLAAPEGASARGSGAPLPLGPLATRDRTPEAAEEDAGDVGASTMFRLLRSPTTSGSSPLTRFLSKLLGMARQPGAGTGGDEIPVGSVGRGDEPAPRGRAVPGRFLHGPPGAPASELRGGTLYPEWHVASQSYRDGWCRVLEVASPPSPAPAERWSRTDDVLLRRLARLGTAPALLRRRPDGEDLDPDALAELAIDLAAGRTPDERLHVERRTVRRDLGALVLLDTSGSSEEPDAIGASVHDRQREAAAGLVDALERLGDRVALFGFRSRGRTAVHLQPIKRFDERFDATSRQRLAAIRPSGYTRLGAAVRHAGQVLAHRSGTPIRLLIVISDGFPYDHGYEGIHAEADVRRALEELREAGIAVLCLSIGASTPSDALERVFGPAAHAAAPRLAALSPQMDRLLLGSLQELAAARSRPGC